MADKKQRASPRDEHGRFISPVNGQPVPKGKPFVAGDSRAKEMQARATQARKEKGDLRKICQVFIESEVCKDENGEPITGGQLMLLEAVKGIKRGNPRFWELLRDTAGFKPADKVIVADVDPEVIADVEQMVLEDEEP